MPCQWRIDLKGRDKHYFRFGQSLHEPGPHLDTSLQETSGMQEFSLCLCGSRGPMTSSDRFNYGRSIIYETEPHPLTHSSQLDPQ